MHMLGKPNVSVVKQCLYDVHNVNTRATNVAARPNNFKSITNGQLLMKCNITGHRGLRSAGMLSGLS